MNRTIKDWLFILSILMIVVLGVACFVMLFDVGYGKQSDILWM